MEEQNLGFVAGIDHSGFDKDAKHIQDSVEQVAKKVEQSGLSVDEFAKRMQGLLASFDRLTQAVDKNTSAQEKAMGAGKKAADAEKQGADKATDAIDKTGKATDELGRKLKNTGDDGAEGFGKLQKAAAGFFTIAAAKEFGQKIFQVRKEMESLQVSFETLAGTDAGKQLYEDIKQFSLNTTMMMGDLAKGAQTLLGFNIEAQKVMPILKQIGDISMGDSQKFNSLTLAFAQMSSTGKLMGQDLLQMINAGFNPLVVISEKTGKSVAELKDEMSKGAISVEMVEEAFRSATEEGGKFHGMLEQQSKALGGAYTKLLGSINDMFNDIGEKSEGIMAGGINAATVLVQNYETVGKVIMSLVGIYGVYKTALMVNIALEKAQAMNRLASIKGVTGMQVATGLLTGKLKALNAVLMANPYAIAAAAVAALGAAIYAAASEAGEMEEAQRRLDEQTRENEASVLNEMRNLDSLNRQLQECEKGTEQYRKVKQSIIDQYGQYYSGLDAEIERVGNLSGVYDKLTEAVRRSIGARNLKSFYDKEMENYDKTVSEKLDKAYDVLQDKYGKDEGSRLYHEVFRKVSDKNYKISEKDMNKLGNAKFWGVRLGADASDGLADFRLSVGRLVREIDDTKEASDAALKKYKDMYEITDEQWNEAIYGGNKGSGTTSPTATTPKGKGGKKGGKDDAADRAARQVELDREVAERTAKARIEADNAAMEAVIASISDNSERERAQEEYDHKQRLQQIESQAEEMKKARYEANKKQWELENKDKHYETDSAEGKAGWQGVSLSEDEMRKIQALRQKENAEYARSVAERHKAEIQSMRDYLKEYGTIQEQKAALAAEYDQKIAETSDEWQRKSLQSQKASELAKLDMKQIAGEIDWSQTFDYVGDLLKDAAKETLEKVNEYMNSSEFKKLSAVDKQSYANLRNQLQDRVGTAANPFSDKVWDELKRNAIAYKNSISYAAKAEEAHTEAVEELKKAQENLEKANTEEEKQLAEIQLNRAKARETETATELNSANTAVTNSQQKLKKSTEEVTKGLNNISEAAQNITSGSLKGFADGLTKLISGGKTDSLSQLGKAGGIVGLILTLIDMLGQDASGRLGEIIDSILNAVDSILDQLLSGELIGAILSHLITGIGKLVGTLLNRLSFGLFSFGGHDNHQKMLDIQEDISNRLGYINDKVSNILDEIKKSSGVDALKKQEEALQAWQNAQESYLRGVMAAGADNYGGGHQDFWHWNKNTRDMAIEIAKYFGISGVNDWQGLFQKITAEQLEEIRKTDINGWWYTMTTQGYNDGAMKDWLDKWADSAETYRQIFTDTNEALTQTTFDNIVNDFSSALLDMDSDAETMSKNFEKYLQDAVIKSLSISKYKPLLDEWYNTFANAMGDGSLSAEERDALMNRWNEITNMGLAERDALKEAFGWGTEEEEEVKDEYFSTLRDSWLSTLTDMEADAEDFNKEIARIMTEDLINSFVLDSAFEEWLEDWKERYTKALEAGDTDALNDLRDEQMKRREELAKEAQEYANATGYADMMKAIEEEEEEAEDAFESLHDSFLDALMDMDTDAEEWGKNIAKTIARQIIEEKMLGEAFDSVLDEWKADVNEIIANGSLTDPATIEAIRGKMDSIKGTLGEMAPVVHDFLSAVGLIEEEVKEVDSAFDNLRSTVVSSFMDLEATSEDFYKDISRTMTEEMVNQLIQSRFQNQLDDINNRWKNALTNGDTEAIKTLREELVALRVSAAESVQPLLDDLAEIEKVVEETEIETPFDNLRESFTNTLMNMEETAEDFSEDLAKIISRALIDQFVLGDAFDKKLDEWKERYAEIMDNDSLTDEQRTKYLNDLKDSISEAREDYTQRARDIQEMMGLTSTSSKEDQQASLNMADKATYDQFELYLGIATAQQIAIEQGNEVRKQILSTLQTMSGITSPNGDTVKEIRSMLRTTNEHLYAIKSATEGIRMEFMPRLQSIDNKLSKL